VESLETGTSLYKNPGQPERKKKPMTKQYRKESLTRYENVIVTIGCTRYENVL